MIYCRTLGPPDVTIDGEACPPELRWRKNLAVLVYLARSPRRSRTREHLCGLLWGEKPESAARHSLNESLRVLRRTGGEDLIRSDGDRVALAQGRVMLDTEQLERFAEEEAWEAASELVGGLFLEGFGVSDASGFEDWMAAERRQWLLTSVRALAGAAEARTATGDIEGALRAAARALALQPLSDAAARAAIRATALTGERSAALELYEDFARGLADDLGAEPQPETTRLADRIRRERSWALPAAIDPADREARRAPLIGRSAPLARLLDAWLDITTTPRAGVLVVEGESGIGKTRLAEEIASRARLDGATVAAIRCVPADRELEHSGLIGLCRGGLTEGPGLVVAHAGALAAVAAEVVEWGERFADEIRGAERLPLTRAFGEILRPIADEGPILLVIDDADYLDTKSTQSLDAALRDLETTPIGVLLAFTRPDDSPGQELLAHIGREQAGAIVRLQPLELDEIRELAARSMPDFKADQTDRLTRRVNRDSAGLPLLVVEILHAVRLGLELEDGECEWPAPGQTLDQTLPGELPSAIVAAIRIGFRRLTEDAQTVLAASAVLEDRVEPSRLAAATGVEEARLTAALNELEWQRWLTWEPRGYIFVASIVRSVVAQDMLTTGQRRRVRERASETHSQGHATRERT